MPKIVDRTARRTEIVDAYLAVVAREGAAAATSRAIAAELGVATGGLWHYFDDFDQVLLAAFQRVYANTTDRIRAAIGESTGMAAVEAALREMLPLDPTTQQEAAVVVAFFGRVAGQPALGRVVSDVEADWRGVLTGHMHEAIDRGELRRGIPVDEIVDTLLALTAAQQIEHVVRTSIGSPTRQWTLVQHALAPYRA
ncbi:MAG TPA: TetR/AcrR family transcriptional regulator [Pseudolysinimonas sp.]|nr:TetR/AcrR family transcriptional regulator [Pseudolysinimonas sp.]